MASNEDSGGIEFVRPTSIGEQLHQHLRDAIIQGDLAPGQALSAAEVSKRYSVSRQPVREAFIKLAEERLVEVSPQRGTFVLRISKAEVLDARFVREVIEVAIVRELALDPAKGGVLLGELRSNLAGQAKIDAADGKGFLALDEEFHRTLAHYHEYAWRVVEGVKSQMDRARYLSFDRATPMPLLIKQHTAIVDAIEARNPDRAEKAIRAHLAEIIKSLPVIAELHPEAFI
jgi:GntR family transcriptional regulator, rspAB operon transcriptional repressor